MANVASVFNKPLEFIRESQIIDNTKFYAKEAANQVSILAGRAVKYAKRQLNIGENKEDIRHYFKQEKDSKDKENLSPQEELFKQIADLNKPCWKPDKKYPKNSQGDPDKFVELQETSLMKFSDQKQKTAALSVLGKCSAVKAFTSMKDNVIEKSTWKDLNFYCGNGDNPNSNFVNKVNRSSTEMGKAYLSGLLAAPTTDVTILKNRQNLIKEFTNDTFKPVASCLKNMKEGEKHLLSFWNPEMLLPNCLVNIYYQYNDKIDTVLNKNSPALEWSFFKDHVGKIATVVTLVALTALLPLVALSIMGVSAIPASLTSFAFKFIGTLDIFYSLCFNVQVKALQVITALAVTVLSATCIKSKFKWLKAHFSMDNLIQEKVFHAATYYRNMKQIYEFLKKNPESIKNLEHFNKLDAFFKDPKLEPLFKVLESKTFDSKAGFFFSRGNTLLAWTLLREQKVQEKLGDALTAVGEIDAFMSASTFMKEHQNSRVKASFPEYIEQADRPAISSKNVWNPFVDEAKVVPSSLKLGTDAPSKNAFLTAGNGCGKSTSITALIEALIMGQTLGLVCAEELKFTPFKYDAASMNIGDVQGEKSRFQAEVDRIKNINDRLKALKAKEFAFVMLDELFTGTDEGQSTALAKAQVEDLGKRDNTISIVVTHNKELTTLGDKEDKLFANYCIKVDEKGQPQYEIERGISENYNALNVASERGLDASIVKDAEAHIKRKSPVVDPAAGVGTL